MTPTQEACARLAASRTQLRSALSSPPPAAGGSSGGGASDWLARLRADPAGAVVAQIVRSWWARHPLRAAGGSVVEIARVALQPLAQRNPLGLVLGAFAVGGLVAWSRPWRWAWRGKALAGGVPGLLLATLATVPPSTWSTALAALMPNPGSDPSPTAGGHGPSSGPTGATTPGAPKVAPETSDPATPHAAPRRDD